MSDKKYSVLLVEDEQNLQEALKLNLELEGYDVTASADGSDAVEQFQRAYFDLIILDVMLPEMDGISVLETIRLRNRDIPVLILSAKAGSADRVLGLKKGADDYLTKPFNLEELLLRVNKLIRKNEQLSDKAALPDMVTFGNNRVDFKAGESVNHRGENINLTRKELLLLKLLIENKNEVVTRERILQAVWGYNVFPTTRTIDNFILNFRKYFEEDSRSPRFFKSARGAGYKFTA